MREKQCSACNLVKLYSEYSKDKSRKDGHCSRCKTCDRLHVKTWAQKNTIRNTKYEWMARNKSKVKAHGVISRLIKTGKLKARVCQVCKEPKTHAHHIDYDYPRGVIWLCTTHHAMIHAK